MKDRNSTTLTGTILTIVLLCGSGCQAQSEIDKRQIAMVERLPTQVGWQTSPEPIIQTGDFLDKALWNDPHVMKEGDSYVMYMTTSSPENPFKPPILPYRAVSRDGITWKLDPPKALMDAKGTPFVSVETPSVVKYKGQYHLFYTGVYEPGGTALFAVGHATSTDGLAWKMDPNELVEATGNPTDWNGTLVGEPGAVVHNGSLLVYFTAVGQLPGQTPSMDQSIGLVTTTDGIHYSEPKRVLQRSGTYPKEDNFCGYSTPMATVHDGRVHLFHDVVVSSGEISPNWQQVALAHAVSSDGGVSFVQDSQAIFTRGDFDWTGGEIRSPSALFEENQVRLWFAGMVPVSEFRPLILRGIKGREFGIGHATIDRDQLSDGM